ncbi:MAG: hypothetical protein JNJ75_04515 [Cyclobacteriaceae bacterium]|nr:hypothetical protein [Cyclobacteriaceae bacterium]
MNNILRYVLLDKRSVRGSISKESLVYSPAQIGLVYEYTKASETKRLLQMHCSEIQNSERKIILLEDVMKQLEAVMKLTDEMCKTFRPLRYLDSVAETLESFVKDKTNRLLYLRMLRRRLNPCFKQLHTYEFYEEHYRTLADGIELLFRSAYHLKKRLSPHFQFHSDILADKEEFDSNLITDYFRILERIAQNDSSKRHLSHEQAAQIVTSYLSCREVMAMGVEAKFLNLDILSQKNIIERLADEAYVIGRIQDELVTIFENVDVPEYVTVVTGPHYGPAFYRDVVTVKIETEDSLKVFVDEWIKSGTD